MKQCIVIGKPNVGKTLFTFRFAAYIGVREVTVKTTHPDGNAVTKTLTIDEAIQTQVGKEPHHTRALHSMTLHLPAGKGRRQFEFIDTSGLSEHIPKDTAIRRAMAQTLAAVRHADVVLHIIDAVQVHARGAVEAIGEVDFQVAQFAQMKDGYVILANKMDLPRAEHGLRHIQKEFTGHHIVPISARTRAGFREVKRLVWQWI